MHRKPERQAALRPVVAAALLSVYSVLCAAGAVSVHAADAPASLDDYQRRVGSADLIAQTLVAADAETDASAIAPALARMRELLPPAEQVDAGGGEIVAVDNAWLSESLDAYEKAKGDTERRTIATGVESRLDDMNEHLAALGDAHGATHGDARARLDEILKRSEFRDPNDDPLTRAVRAVRDRFVAFIFWLQELIFGGTKGSVVGSGVRSIIIVVGVIAIVYLIRMGLRLIRSRDPEREGRARTVLGEKIAEGTTAADLAASARALAASGDHRGAIRKLFVALLYDLDERGLVRLEAEATNREYLARVRALGPIYPVMASMTDIFDRVWYGGEQAGANEYANFSAQYDEATRAAAGAGNPAAARI